MEDESSTISDLKLTVKTFCDERDWDQFHGAKDLAIGVVTEASELLEVFRFKSEEEIQGMMRLPGGKARIGAELADTFYFLLRFAQKYDFNISKELEKKMEENEKKYPKEKSKGSNRKYSERN